MSRTSLVTVPRSLAMRAEMQPDMYGGEECDQAVPAWFCYAEGDKEADTSSEPLTLDAAQFPPGTLVEISEPLCPKCESYRTRLESGGYEAKCECGFDWQQWEEEQYG